MVIYPIRVPRKHYGGSKEALRRKAADYNSDAAKLEDYLNKKIASSPDPIQQFLYGFIAPDIGMSQDRVREILFAVDTGHNGLTVAKSEEAWRAFLKGSEPSTPG